MSTVNPPLSGNRRSGRRQRLRQRLADAASILNPFPPDDRLADVPPAQALAADWANLGVDAWRALDNVATSPKKTD